MKVMRNERGFTLVEMMVSMLIMLVVTGAVFGLLNPSQGIYRAQPEVSDMQQRLRVAANTLESELMMAGAGTYLGTSGNALLNYFAPIMPYRIGTAASDQVSDFYQADAISLMYIHTAVQTTISKEMPQPSAELTVEESRPGCPQNKPKDQPCGFKEGMRVVIFDDTGSFDLFTLTHVQDSDHLQHNRDTLSKKYLKGAQIAQMSLSTYYLKTDDATNTYQLRHYDGYQTDEPMVDNVVDLKFQYFGEPRPPVMLKSLGAETGPYTSYGPKPSTAAAEGWKAGENCIFAEGDPPTPKLTDLAPGDDRLVELTEATLTDGPFCPNATAPYRFDADLLRVRTVGVLLRVQVASATLRGPAGALFRKGGYSKGGVTWVPDQEVRFDVSPRNLNLGR